MSAGYVDYDFRSCDASHMHCHFLPKILDICGNIGGGQRVLDVGCGNGFTAGYLLAHGFEVVGIDLSNSGIELARRAYPDGRFEVLSADDCILENLREEPFDFVVSTEVVEHLYDPRSYAKGCYSALKPGGRFICTTPYHGYVKNLFISLFNKWDTHLDPLWLGGHIKLWSRATITRLLTESGFEQIQVRGAGRIPWLWMTMVVAAVKPVS